MGLQLNLEPHCAHTSGLRRTAVAGMGDGWWQEGGYGSDGVARHSSDTWTGDRILNLINTTRPSQRIWWPREQDRPVPT